MEKQNNIKKNMLSLKALQAELEQLKKTNQLNSSSTQTVNTTPAGSKQVVTKFYMHSHMGLLWVISFLIGWAHKIPMLSKIIAVLNIWYGKTTWWQIVTSLRKIIVVFNAIIGLMTMFKITGITTDDGIGGVYGLALAYFDLARAMVSKAALWGLRLFVRTPPIFEPEPKPGAIARIFKGKAKDSLGKTNTSGNTDPSGSLREEYAYPLDRTIWPPRPETAAIVASWIPDWLFYGGIAVIGIGVAYLGYTLITNPYKIADFISPNKAPGTTPAGGTPDTNLGGSATADAAEALGAEVG